MGWSMDSPPSLPPPPVFLLLLPLFPYSPPSPFPWAAPLNDNKVSAGRPPAPFFLRMGHCPSFRPSAQPVPLSGTPPSSSLRLPHPGLVPKAKVGRKRRRKGRKAPSRKSNIKVSPFFPSPWPGRTPSCVRLSGHADSLRPCLGTRGERSSHFPPLSPSDPTYLAPLSYPRSHSQSPCDEKEKREGGRKKGIPPSSSLPPPKRQEVRYGSKSGHEWTEGERD